MTRLGQRLSHRGRFAVIAASIVACLIAAGPVWSAVDAGDLADQISAERLQSRIEELTALGSRMSGYSGNEQAADLVLNAFEELGMKTYTQEFNLPTPLETSASLDVNGTSYEVHGLWPNLCRTSAVPVEGLTGPVIYVGKGDLADFNGMSVKDAIVLMDFNSGQAWLHAPLLDAAAVVFIGADNTTRGEAEVKWLRVPVNVPRVWLDPADAEPLKAAAEQHAQATLKVNIDWEDKVNRNIIGILPGSDPEMSKEAIVLEAYYDSISVVPAVAPGAENAVSIATLLELAEIYSQEQYRPKRSIIFLACSGHFEALAGAREFVNLWGKEPRKSRDREDRYKELERELKHLQDALAETQDQIQKMQRRQQELVAVRSTLSEAQLKRQEEMANRVNVGQLEIDDEAAHKRVDRLQDDIARKQDYMALWKVIDQFDTIHMFVGLDLSTHTRALGAFQVGWYYAQAHLLRFYSPLGKQFTEYAGAVAEKLGLVTGLEQAEDKSEALAPIFVDGINPIKGREWHTFFPGKIAFDHEMMIRGGRPGFTFTTVNDARQYVDTPLDTVDRLEMDNLVAQDRLLVNLLYRFLDDPTLSERALKRVEALKKMDELEDSRGTVLEFRRRESFVPNSPVPGSLVLVQAQYRVMMGVHTTVWTIANETSEFTLRGESANRAVQLEAFNFDRDNGNIIYAPDRGTDGDKKYPRNVYGRAGLRRPVIVFRCAATDLYDLVDERYFQTLEKVFVYDAKDYSEPVSFGYSIN